MRVRALQSFFDQEKNYQIGQEYEITDQKLIDEWISKGYIEEVPTTKSKQ